MKNKKLSFILHQKNAMTKKLTLKDIKTIKFDMRFGLIFSIVFLSLFFLVFNVYGFIIEKINIYIIILSNFGAIVLAFLIWYLSNIKLLRDLDAGTKYIIIKNLDKKEKENSNEAGSGMGIKIKDMKMNDTVVFHFIIDNYRYLVNIDEYFNNEENEKIEMHYSSYSKTFLGFEKIFK